MIKELLRLSSEFAERTQPFKISRFYPREVFQQTENIVTSFDIKSDQLAIKMKSSPINSVAEIFYILVFRLLHILGLDINKAFISSFEHHIKCNHSFNECDWQKTNLFANGSKGVFHWRSHHPIAILVYVLGRYLRSFDQGNRLFLHVLKYNNVGFHLCSERSSNRLRLLSSKGLIASTIEASVKQRAEQDSDQPQGGTNSRLPVLSCINPCPVKLLRLNPKSHSHRRDRYKRRPHCHSNKLHENHPFIAKVAA